MFVSPRNFFFTAFTRITFSAPSAFPAIRFSEPRSTYLTADGKITCTVLSYVISSPCGGIMRLKPIFRVSPSNLSPLLGCATAATAPISRAQNKNIFFPINFIFLVVFCVVPFVFFSVICLFIFTLIDCHKSVSNIQVCKRRHFTFQNTAFYIPKDGKSEAERPYFASYSVTS